MSRTIKRFGAVIILSFLLFFSFSASATAGQTYEDLVPPSDSKQTVQVDSATGEKTVENPGVLEEFGPPGVIITTILTGALMIFRAYNEGKKIDVTTYKERAADAETRANEEIGKVHKKLAELDKKLDEVIADRDEYRDNLEERKAQFTQQVLDIEKRHQLELEEMHAALIIELHTRHRLERLLAEHGISIPEVVIATTSTIPPTDATIE